MEKKLNRRQFLQASAGAAAGSLLAACAPKTVVVEKKETVVVEKEVEKVVTATPLPPEPVELVYYDRTSDAPSWADVYNAAQNDVTVKVEIQPPGTRYEQLIAAIMAGNAPDVIGVDCVQVGRFAELKALAPLQDVLPQGIKDSYFQSLITTDYHFGFYKGDLLGVPFWLDMSVLYYNKTHLEGAGGDPEVGFRSWDDYIVYGKEAVKQGRFGFSLGQVNLFIYGPWIWAQGGDFVNADWTASLIADDPSYGNMLQFAHDMVCVHKITNDAPATLWGEMVDLFTAQKAMSVQTGGGLAGLIRSEFPELWEVLGLCLIPGPKEGQKSSFIGGNVASISTQSKYKEEALDFVIWLTTSDEGQTVTGELGFLCGTPAGMGLPVFQKDAAVYSVFKEGLDIGYPVDNDPRHDEVIAVTIVAFVDAMLCEKSIDEIVRNSHEEINKILQR
jgi:multiple sugar transport system substrate-binding protein